MLSENTEGACFEVWKHNMLEKVGLSREVGSLSGEKKNSNAKNSNAMLSKFFLRISSSFPLFMICCSCYAHCKLNGKRMEKRNSSDKIGCCNSTTP